MTKELAIKGHVITIDTETLTEESLKEQLIKESINISDENISFLVERLKEEEKQK